MNDLFDGQAKALGPSAFFGFEADANDHDDARDRAYSARAELAARDPPARDPPAAD